MLGVASSSSKSFVPGGKHRPNETDSPFYSDAALDITFHTTTPAVSRDWYNPGSWTGPCDAPHGFLSQKAGMNNKLFVCFFFFNGVEEKTELPYFLVQKEYYDMAS